MGTPNQEQSEAELRAAYEEEMKKVRVEDLLLEAIVSMVNFGMRRTGLVEGTESERDPAQVKLAIESVRALLPLIETAAPQQLPAIRQALSQLQLAFVRIGGGPPEPGAAASGSGPAGSGVATPPAAGGAPGSAPAAAEQPAPPEPGEAGPAQRSGRLWVPGQ
jgi:hypothetical protein